MADRGLDGTEIDELRMKRFGEVLWRKREECLPGERGRKVVEEYLRRHGLAADAGVYREIEMGRRLPQEPRPFLDIVTMCLRLGQAEHTLLLRHLAFDLVLESSGEWLAVSAFTVGSVAPTDW